MKIPEPEAATLRAALDGRLEAIDALIATIQPGVYRLAVHALGHRDDAADATQEILLKVVTHLAGFRGEAAFSTWVWRVAYNHLATARTRKAESPEVSLEHIAERLDQGLEFAAELARTRGEPMPLTPEDKLEARQLALACSQSMLMALDREQRLACILDAVVGLDSATAAEVLGITPEAYRQRLSRARARLDAFVGRTCGLASPEAACRCERQLPAVRHRARSEGGGFGADPGAVVARPGAEQLEAERQLAALARVSDAAAVLRAHPAYRAPQALHGAIRTVLVREGLLDRGASA